MAHVTLRNVTKVYPGGILAVDRATLEIANKEFMVLVGPSGCGKSTTLRMVAGLEEISEGEIAIAERVVNEAAEILGIKPLLHRKPKELSGGERQRVALGRAIVRKPLVFLFDEPLSNL